MQCRQIGRYNLSAFQDIFCSLVSYGFALIFFSVHVGVGKFCFTKHQYQDLYSFCLLYTSDAADE